MRQIKDGLRRLLTLGALSACAVALAPGSAAAAIAGSEDGVGREYHRLLLEHTRWAESAYDKAAGHYGRANFDFAVVLGNAVVLRFGTYDADVAGISRAELEEHTVRTIAHFAATNRANDPGGDWGGRLYFDSTFESYFVAAARLMWDRLDEATRADVDSIVRETANYTVRLGSQEDPLSPGWTTNGLLGAFRSNSRIEEMGVRTMPLAAALAYLPGDPAAPRWREWLNRWSTNMTGLPPADEANQAAIDGVTVADWNSAQNIFDTFAVENHDSFAPHYQGSFAAYPGRNAVHALIAGTALPQVLHDGPNARELGETLRQVGTDAGTGAYPMNPDRYHLYGRDILPIAYQSVLLGDRDAARAERMLAERLGPYQDHAPRYRLTKFSGEPHYEPEARAELAIAYLLHYARERLAGDVTPVSERRYYENAGGPVDFGEEVGLVTHQSADALAMAVTKPGFVKFGFVPEHDDWFLDPSGGAPSFIPSTATSVSSRNVELYKSARDGFDGTATLLRTPVGFAGFTTLPTGTAVYATTGLGSGEGALRLHNLAMPGIRGLDGDRTFRGRGREVTLSAEGGDGGVDELRFDAQPARYVRFVGARPETQYGYSIWDFEVYAGAGGDDLARGRPTTATSSYSSAYTPERATDGDPATRWAVSVSERPRPDSSLTVDLGEPRSVSRVRVNWDTAYASAYRIEVSTDGETWRTAETVPQTARFDGDWLNIDDRVGFVVRGSVNPITAGGLGVTLSDGPASGSAGMVVEARPREDAGATEAEARRPEPSSAEPALRASLADGHLSLFNLGAAALEHVDVRFPAGESPQLYRGTQRTEDGRIVYEATLPAAAARLEAPRFRLTARDRGPLPDALRVTVASSREVTVENRANRVAQLTLTPEAGGARRDVTVPAGARRTVRIAGVATTPVADLARLARTFPTSPLPAGMTDPDLAVDGDPATAWSALAGGRMVVDLGRSRTVARVGLRWGPGQVEPVAVELSDDGLSYRPVARSEGREREEAVAIAAGAARYVAITTRPAVPGAAGLADLAVYGAETAASP